MAIIHVEESEAALDFGSLIRRAAAGDTVIIEDQGFPTAIMEPSSPPRRTIEQCIALLPQNPDATET